MRSANTASTRPVLRTALHHSLRKRRQLLRVALVCSPTARMRAWTAWAACRPTKRPRCPPRKAPIGCRQRRGSPCRRTKNQADLGHGIDDAVGPGRLDAVHGTGQRAGGPQQAAERVGEDMDIHAVLAALAQAGGAVGGDPINGEQRAVQGHERPGCHTLEGQLKSGNQPRPGDPRPRGRSGRPWPHLYRRRLPAGCRCHHSASGPGRAGPPDSGGRRRQRVPTRRRRSASCLVRKRKCELDRSIADGQASTTTRPTPGCGTESGP